MKTNVIQANFGPANDNRSKNRPAVIMTRAKKVGDFRVYTNLAMLSHEEFFIEIFQNAVAQEKEAAMRRMLNS